MYSQKIKSIDFRWGTFLLLTVISFVCYLIFSYSQPESWSVWIQVGFISYFFVIQACFTFLFKKVNMINWDFDFKKQFHNTKTIGVFCIIFGILGLAIIIGAFYIYLGANLIALDKTEKEELQPYQKDENTKAVRHFITGYLLFILFIGVVNVINAEGLIKKPEWLQYFLEVIITGYFVILFIPFEKSWGVIQLETYKKDFSRIGKSKETRQSLLSPLAFIIGLGIFFIFGIFILLTYLKMWEVEKEEGPNGPNWNSYKNFKG